MRHIIVGNGVAGIAAAIELAHRQAGEVEIYTAERHPYYFRPRLPYFLAGEISQDDLYIRPPSWYEKRGIKVNQGIRVAHLIPDREHILIAGIDLTSAGTVVAKGQELVGIRHSDPQAGVYKLVGAIVIGNKALASKLERLVTRKAKLSREGALNL